MRLFRRKTLGATKKTCAGRNDEDTAIPEPLVIVLNSVHEMETKPPVTLVLLGVMYLLHVQAMRAPTWILPLALCPGKVVANKEIGAVLVSPFLHVEELYLYQSMWVEGEEVERYKLEVRLGSIGFCVLLVYLIMMSQTLIMFGAHLISWRATQECFTGFSGVLTAMKVILNVSSPTFTKLYSFEVPTKYAAWLELVITYLLVPKLPLLTQAAGLIAGYIYVVTPNAEAIVSCASRHVQHLLIQVGLVERPFQWWQIWPKFVDSMRRRKQRRGKS